MIKYRYALASNDSTVDITTLTDTTRYDLSPYLCFGCGRELIANLGTKKTKYFSHKNVGACNPESYLHNLAKHMFFGLYSRCLDDGKPFIFRQKVPGECSHNRELLGRPCKVNVYREHDLTRYFTKARLEAPIEGVIPDILLTSEDDQDHLFIEIAVTHKCAPEKINLEFRIIEIEVKEEVDLKAFAGCGLSEEDERIRLFNIERRSVQGDICQGSCHEKVHLFLVYESGKALLKRFELAEARKVLANKKLLRRENLGPYDPNRVNIFGENLFKDKVREAFFDGIPIRNCYNCRYHGLGEYEDPVFCKLRKEGVNSNEAADCTTYKSFQSRSEAKHADKVNEEYLRRPGRPWVINLDVF